MVDSNLPEEVNLDDSPQWDSDKPLTKCTGISGGIDEQVPEWGTYNEKYVADEGRDKEERCIDIEETEQKDIDRQGEMGSEGEWIIGKWKTVTGRTEDVAVDAAGIGTITLTAWEAL